MWDKFPACPFDFGPIGATVVEFHAGLVARRPNTSKEIWPPPATIHHGDSGWVIAAHNQARSRGLMKSSAITTGQMAPAQRNQKNLGYAWYVVIVLMACYTLSFIDRQILSLLVSPIKQDLGISDTRISGQGSAPLSK